MATMLHWEEHMTGNHTGERKRYRRQEGTRPSDAAGEHGWQKGGLPEGRKKKTHYTRKGKDRRRVNS